MKIATYNINGINGRLPNLLRWLKEAKPDIVCLQELKATSDKFPEQALREAGYNAVWAGQKSWNGVAILAKKGLDMQLVRDKLPGDPKDDHSRYIEVIVAQMVIGCIYLPNGNPWPGPKFDYKLAWLKRLTRHAKKLLAHNVPVMLIGDYNVMPTDLDVYKPESWLNNALFRPEARKLFQKLVNQGWMDAIRTLYPNEKIFTFWDYFRNAFPRDAGLRLDHFLLSPHLQNRLKDGGVDRHVRGWPKTSDHAPAWIILSN